jgi:hypothetical protein
MCINAKFEKINKKMKEKNIKRKVICLNMKKKLDK